LYDLKGSTVNRHVKLTEDQKTKIARKDLDFHYVLELGYEKKARLMEQLEFDIRFLESHNICDYSLLVGIHFLTPTTSSLVNEFESEKGLFDVESGMLRFRNSKSKVEDYLRSGEDSDSSEDENDSHTDSPSSIKTSQENPDSNNRSTLRPSSNTITSPNLTNLTNLTNSSLNNLNNLSNSAIPSIGLVEESSDQFLDSSNLEPSLFKQHCGGMRAANGVRCIYYVGIIDTLTEYNFKKMAEHMIKSIRHNATEISAIPPRPYRIRFQKYVNSITR